MPTYGPDVINFEGVNGHRYWFYEPFVYTGIIEIDERLSGFPVSIFLPQYRPLHETPLVIGLQGMGAPYGWNAFIVPTLTEIGIAVALFDTPFAGERSLARTFTALVQDEIKPLNQIGVSFDTKLLLQIFGSTAHDIAWVRDFCCERYGLSDGRLALFGVSMGVLLSAFAFAAEGLGERLLGTIGHADLQSFAKSWGSGLLPDLAASPVGKLAEILLSKKRPDIKAGIDVLRVAKNLKYPDAIGKACNPMNYVDWVKPERRVRFLVGAKDPMVNVGDAQRCAKRFPDGACYVVPGLGHGVTYYSSSSSFVDHVRYFLITQLADWRG
jgi:pimeloyl-ACP methyl ester carboxylesterase